MKYKTIPTLALVGGLLSQIQVTHAANYTLLDLGTFGGNSSHGYDINDSGQVTGYSSYDFGDSSAFIYQNGVMTDIGTLGGNLSRGFSINASGQIAGDSRKEYGSYDIHAFATKNGVMKDINSLGDGTYSSSTGINDSGQVTGHYVDNNGNTRGFVTQNGVMVDLGTLSGGSIVSGGVIVYSADINNSGHVTGGAAVGNSGHAFIYQNGVMTDIGTLPSGTFSEGYDISNNGQITGRADNSTGSIHAFIYQNGVMTDIGSLGDESQGLGINDSGVVVGLSYTADGEHAFVYQNGVMSDLNTLIAMTSGWTLTDATAINNKGQIVANGFNDLYQYHTFLLSPITAVPLPPSVFSFAAGLFGLGFLGRKKQSLAPVLA